MTAIENGVALWLKWQRYLSLKDEPKSGLSRVSQASLFPKGEPECPNVYLTYLKCKKWGMWSAGGYADQPHILLMEFNACEAGEGQYTNVMLPYLEALSAN